MGKSRYYLEKLFYHRTRKQWNLIFPNLSVVKIPENFINSYIIVYENDSKISLPTKDALTKQLNKSTNNDQSIKFVAVIPDQKKLIMAVEKQFDKLILTIN